MKRCERLAKERMIEVYIGSLEKAKIISKNDLRKMHNLRYLCSDPDAFYNGENVHANVYEDEESGNLCATID